LLYRHRFGSLRRAYKLIGYGHPDQFKNTDLRRRTLALRAELIERIAAAFPCRVSIIQRGRRWRTRLRLSNRIIVSVLIARSLRRLKSCVRWQVDPHPMERKYVTLLARLTQGNGAFLDFHVFSCIERKGRFRISLADSWLKSGSKLPSLGEFCDVAEKLGRFQTH
jgi:hypothetical protein